MQPQELGILYFIISKCDSVPIGAFKVKVDFGSEYAIFIFCFNKTILEKCAAVLCSFRLSSSQVSNFDDVVVKLEALVRVPLVAGFQHHT